MPADSTAVIVLVGYSGVGKSTLGPMLAEALGRTFFDMDLELADLPDVAVRTARTRCDLMTRLCALENVVIASGWEDFTDTIMPDEVKRSVFSVWLSAETRGRIGRTIRVYTDFHALPREEQEMLFSRADLHVPLGAMDVPTAAAVLIDRVADAISRDAGL